MGENLGCQKWPFKGFPAPSPAAADSGKLGATPQSPARFAGPINQMKMTLVASESRPIRSRAAKPPGTARHEPFRLWLLRSPLYSLTLGHRTPQSFFAVAPDS